MKQGSNACYYVANLQAIAMYPAGNAKPFAIGSDFVINGAFHAPDSKQQRAPASRPGRSNSIPGQVFLPRYRVLIVEQLDAQGGQFRLERFHIQIPGCAAFGGTHGGSNADSLAHGHAN